MGEQWKISREWSNEMCELRPAIESILLVSDAPVKISDVSRVLHRSEKEIKDCLKLLSAEFDARSSGFDLRENEEGWRLYTRAKYCRVVESFLLHGQSARLTRAALETLAVIAYTQPCTRARIASIRGVNVDGVVRTLLMRGLIREVPPATHNDDSQQKRDNDRKYGASAYETTSLFLEQLGMDSLEELPDIAPLLPDVDVIDEL